VNRLRRAGASTLKASPHCRIGLAALVHVGIAAVAPRRCRACVLASPSGAQSHMFFYL
jgi:hypothetical protein